MRKYFIFILAIILLSTQVQAKEIKNYSNSFFGVYGKKASVMGKVDGSTFEIWIYPYKVLHDLQFKVTLDGFHRRQIQLL
jgi:hypothetical protein